MNKHTKNFQGITSLVAVMVMSVALTLGVGIFQLLYAEMLISRDQANSVIAEYAAHAGVECALYNVFTGDVDAKNELVCNGKKLDRVVDGDVTYFGKDDAYVVGDACTTIEIEKVAPVEGTKVLIVRSRGHYPCGEAGAVERAIQTSLRRGG